MAGSGKDGRITKSDAEAAKATVSQAVIAKAPTPPAPEVPVVTESERTTRSEKMSRLRKTVAQRLVNAQHTQALLTTFNEVDLTEVEYSEKIQRNV